MDEWTQLVLTPILNGQVPSASDLNRLGGLALFSADTDKIKEYVFESAKLPEIRGASMILDELNQGWPEDKGPNIRRIFKQHGLPIGHRGDESTSCVIFAGGGSLLALVPENLAEQLKQEIEALFPRETDVATITCVYQPVKDPRLLHTGFQRLVAAQALLLRRYKEDQTIVPFFEALPQQQRCASCGSRPASSPTPRQFSSELLCPACLKKVEHSTVEQGKKRWTKEFEGYIRRHLPADQLHRYLGKATDMNSILGADDLEEIARAGHDRNAIGFIYADGDGVGSFIESSTQISEYQAKSQTLKTLRELVYAALAHYLQVSQVERQDKGQVFIHPFEVVTIGGDDLLLIVPGDVALPIAVEICQSFADILKAKFEEWAKKGWHRPKRPLTMSAGVVIAHHHNPVRYIRDLAEQLLKKSAKRHARQSPAETPEGAIDFLTLKSQSMLWSELGELRRNAYEFSSSGGKKHISLVGRPYLLSEISRLLAHARLLRDANFPRSQIQGIRQALRKAERFGWMWPILWYLRQQARLPRLLRLLIHYLDVAWAALNPAQGSLPPWRHVKTERGTRYYTTIWEDLHEVRDLLPRLENEPPDIQNLGRNLLYEVLHTPDGEEVSNHVGRN